MNIQGLVRQKYETLDAYASTHIARKLLLTHEGVVLLLEGEPIGVLTMADLVKQQYLIALDCLTQKPMVECTDKLDMVAGLMKTSANDVLPVYNKGKFWGIVVQADLLSSLQTTFDQQKLSLLAAAHDLKVPFAAISMLGDMLTADPAFSKHPELINQLNKTCEYALSLIQNILVTEQSLTDSLLLEEEDLDELVVECVASFSEQLKEKNITASAQLDGGIKVKADRPKLKRAITNILSNSIKFTRPGGKVNLSTRAAKDGNALLMVQDSGIGIPSSIQKSVFDKFTRAKRPGTAGEQTTGLGLYLTKEIVEWHGGTISLESDGKSGTSFTISLPPAH